MNRLSYLKRRRIQSGQAHSVELGLALGIVFIVLFFPFIDFLFLTFTYGAAYFLNFAQLRQAALTKNADVAAEMKQITTDWSTSGMGKFVSEGQKEPETEVKYIPTGVGTDVEVAVKTTVYAKSMISIPFLSHIPGFGAPMQFTFNGQRLLENSGDYTPPPPVKP